jgi:DMSO reductase family type II enzyme heme b subunit
MRARVRRRGEGGGLRGEGWRGHAARVRIARRGWAPSGRVASACDAAGTGRATPPPAARPPRLAVVGALIVVVSVGAGIGAAWAQAGDAQVGKAVYEKRCALCHGDKGDGKGPAADLLDPRPRDFTTGIYKIRTAAGKTPTDRDLFDVITRGMPGTFMPAWKVLPEKDRWSLVAYLKTVTPDKFTGTPKTQELPKEVAASPESIKRGREMYEAIECNKCHGAEGRGDGPSRPELKDEWGHPIRPANLTKRWNFRGGAGRADIALRLATGVLGTPMPTFIDSVEKPDDIWHLANYVASLGPESPDYATLLSAQALKGAIPGDPAAEFWRTLAPQNVPLVGQVIIDPRNFNPSIDMVTLRAAWNDTEVAFHLTWDDPSQSTADAATKAYPDAVSLQFPPTVAGGADRPYFLMGSDADAVYLLRWENGKGAMEATANGPTKIAALAGSEATGQAVYANGQYRLVIKRPLASKDPTRPTFRPAIFTPVALQAWDGGAGETGTKASVTSWYYLRLEEPQSTRRFVVPPVVAILTLAAMLVVVRVAHRRA